MLFFFPAVTESHFKQEGHHFDFTEPGNTKSSLCIKGIVYNEMKGVYSDLNGIINKEEAKSLFPVNAYGKDSGGCPDSIPTLTYEKFVDFHKTYYHPSNAYFFVYGGFDIKNTLKIIHEGYLSKFEKISVDSEIEDEPKWDKPIKKTIYYPISKNESTNRKTAVTINFQTNKLTDTIESLSMSVLENYLLDNPSSPLRKALIDSKLGEALTSSGYADYQRDTYFTVGLKGTEEKNTDRIVQLIFDTFRKIVKEGINKNKLESSFHRIEFHSKEILSSYPVILMDRVYNYWLYGADPLCLLKLNSYLDKLKEIYGKDPCYFERMIEKNILNNSHYSILTFIPNKNYFVDRDKLYKTKMNNLKVRMSEEELNKIALEALELEKMHHTPNSGEALATLPHLSILDIREKPQCIDREITEIEGRPLIVNNVFSNEINYINFSFDLRGIESDLIDYLPIFKLALLGMGAAGLTYAEMAEREAAVSGGITAGLSAEGSFDDPNDCFPYFSISSKALDSKFKGMLEIIRDRLLKADFKDASRLNDILIQRKTLLRGSILGSGSSYATSFAGRNLNYNHSLGDRFGGISYIRFISKLADNYKKEKDDIVEKLVKIQKFILNRNRFYISFIGSESQKKTLNNWYGDIIKSSSSEQISPFKQVLSNGKITKDIISVPSNVAFNGAVFQVPKATEQNAAALLLLSQSLSYGYLWEEIRAKKGAYGARASYSTLGGSFSFSTYRDPCIKESYNTFNNVFDFIERKMKLNSKAVEQEIIGSIKRLDRPVRPGEVVGISMIRYLRKITDEYRSNFRKELLNLNGKKIKEIALDMLKPAYQKASMCTIAGKNMLEEVNDFINFSKFNLDDL